MYPQPQFSAPFSIVGTNCDGPRSKHGFAYSQRTSSDASSCSPQPSSGSAPQEESSDHSKCVLLMPPTLSDFCTLLKPACLDVSGVARCKALSVQPFYFSSAAFFFHQRFSGVPGACYSRCRSKQNISRAGAPYPLLVMLDGTGEGLVANRVHDHFCLEVSSFDRQSVSNELNDTAVDLCVERTSVSVR